MRPRRLRKNDVIRALVRENYINVENLIYPIFVVEGNKIKEEIPSMPDVYRFSIDMLSEELEELIKLNIKTILLFGVPSVKDEYGTQAYNENGIVQKAIKYIKRNYPEIYVITDVCLCGYTTHGHCGIVKDGEILNDETLKILSKIALSHAYSGADMVAPSAMMDFQVKAIREELDHNGFYDVAIMSYSAKFNSSFYGPFRDAAQSAPKFSDRRTYQMDTSNFKEALKEIELDIKEGADIVMIKPALCYLDIIKKASEIFNVPISAYNVSGEYTMIKLMAKYGYIDYKKAVMEVLTSIKRAGADIIITYFAKEVARWKENF
ncbi:MAG: porphobilinogen synthase [candidate division WOR-3 bacterium]|jgi:porphobilinogen synthase